jgi:hypothetical protein
MKQILTYAAFSLLLISCQKGTENGTPSLDPTKSYSIRVEAPAQTVKTNVENNRLKLDHYAVTKILVEPVEYSRSWAIVLEENWEGTYLNGLDYNCMNEFGTYAFNWRASNLHHMNTNQKSVADVTVEGKRMKQITISRTFHFYKDFPNQQAAINEQNQVLARQNEAGKFRAFFTYNGVNSLPNSANGNLQYVRQ